MKYQYRLYTWGGFYNSCYQDIHNQEEGFHYFETWGDRENYINNLKSLEKELGAFHLMIDVSEGYDEAFEITTLHRVVRFGGVDYYSTNQIPNVSSYELAVFIMEDKWYPGHNDYPLGENFDYSYQSSYEIVQEWITGSFTVEKE